MKEKTIFITGASAGFGAACARMFATNGNRLILTARRVDPLLKLQDKLATNADVHIIPLDVTDRNAVQGAIESLPERFRSIDVLLNNAGLALGLEPAHRVDMDDWDTMVDTNIKGVMYCTRCILPGMVARNTLKILPILALSTRRNKQFSAMSSAWTKPKCCWSGCRRKRRVVSIWRPAPICIPLIYRS